MESGFCKGFLIKTIVGTAYRSNCYLIWSDSARAGILIDPNDAEQIEEYIDRNQLRIDYIILTHEHYDHIAALHDIQKVCRCPVIASRKCKEELPYVQKRLERTFELYLYFLTGEKRQMEVPRWKEAVPDLLFEEKMRLEWHGMEINLLETPGHSGGSVSVFINKSDVFSGDALLPGKASIVKLLTGNREVYDRDTIPVYEALDDDVRVWPGHGRKFTVGEKRKCEEGLYGVLQ